MRQHFPEECKNHPCKINSTGQFLILTIQKYEKKQLFYLGM